MDLPVSGGSVCKQVFNALTGKSIRVIECSLVGKIFKPGAASLRPLFLFMPLLFGDVRGRLSNPM